MTDITSHSHTSQAAQERLILVAIDFSSDSKAALKWACNSVTRGGGSLVLLHIVHDLASHPGFYKPAKEKKLKPLQEMAESMMADFLDEFKNENPGLVALNSAELQFIKGLPPTRIVEVSELLDASMIAIGSRGFTSLPHQLLGSVAQRVAELSKCPVVVVKTEETQVPDKKELKRQKKQQKKDRQWLKSILGISQKPKAGDDSNG